MIGQIAGAALGAIGGGKKGGESKQAEGGGGGPLGKLNQIINTLKGALGG